MRQEDAKDGAYCFGFILEGARWDTAGGYVEESKPKEMFSVIPVVYCKALPLPPEGKEDKTVYQCPAYKTEERFTTYVFTAQLKTRHPPRKWILAVQLLNKFVKNFKNTINHVNFILIFVF